MRRVSDKATQDVSVNVKLADGADEKQCLVKLAKIVGVRKIVHLFPSEDDPKLAKLYVIKIRGKNRSETLRTIRRRGLVEYANIAERRQLAQSL